MLERFRRKRPDSDFLREISEEERLQRLFNVELFLLRISQQSEYDSLLERQLKERIAMKERHIEEFKFLRESFKTGSTEGLSQLIEGRPTNLDNNSKDIN